MKKYYLIVLGVAFLAGVSRVEGQVTLNPNPSRVVGQPRLDPTSNAPNLVEGRELSNPQAIAVDRSLNPPALYVADTGNSRVLAWRNASSFSNGRAADLVLGQRNKYTAATNGPGLTDFISGLNQPTAVAVDSSGNLYVADSGNNRILRYPTPFARDPSAVVVDIAIGQTSVLARGFNQGKSAPTEKTIGLNGNGAPFRSGLAFDGQGNLWFSDAGNNRVLRYPKASLNANGPAADLVLGHGSFTTSSLPSKVTPTEKDLLANPSGLAFDSAGRLFVADGLGRVVVFAPPFSTGMLASRLMGIVKGVQGQPPPPPISESTLGSVSNNTISPPNGVFTIGNTVFVADTPVHRILQYDSYDNWPPESTTFSPAAKGVVGQADFTQSAANRGQVSSGANSLSAPVGAVASGTDVFVADSLNNRVLAFSQTIFVNPDPKGQAVGNRVLGQDDFPYSGLNLIEGRELFFYGGQFYNNTNFVNGGAGVVVDKKSDPPHLYVADYFNNRVLGFKDVRKVKPGDKADLVIGQPDLKNNFLNYPQASQTQPPPTDQGLFLPAGLALDSNGNLYIADFGNGRVLRFPQPFVQPQTSGQHANLVLGQQSFTSFVPDATSVSLAAPFGLAFTQNGHLLVSDTVQNRVLLFRKSGDFSNGQAASTVFGQPDFTTRAAGTADNRLFSPHHIAADTDDRLYVADTGNNRVLIYGNANQAGVDPSPGAILRNIASPYGVYVSPENGDILIADTFNNRVIRYPHNVAQGVDPPANPPTTNAALPLAATLDAFGDLIVAESSNRVSLFYPELAAVNASNFFTRPLAPGMIAALFPRGGQFGSKTAPGPGSPLTLPLPKTFGGVQVLMNGTPVPLFFVSPGQINFQVPNHAPTSGTAEFQVVDAVSGQILASFQVRMDIAAPGLFAANGSGTGQVAAINQDGTINGPQHPIPRGKIITLYGTGPGFISGAPPDGSIAGKAVNTDDRPKVFVGTDFVPDANVQYSGLAPTLVGVWQLNVKIPDVVAPGTQPVFVLIKTSYNSGLDPDSGMHSLNTIEVSQ